MKENPDLNIVSHFKNIKDSDLGIPFFKNFSIVFMALDNEEARSFVNSRCILLDLPILEAGTTGYIGQVKIKIKKNINFIFKQFRNLQFLFNFLQ